MLGFHNSNEASCLSFSLSDLHCLTSAEREEIATFETSYFSEPSPLSTFWNVALTESWYCGNFKFGFEKQQPSDVRLAALIFSPLRWRTLWSVSPELDLIKYQIISNSIEGHHLIAALHSIFRSSPDLWSLPARLRTRSEEMKTRRIKSLLMMSVRSDWARCVGVWDIG